MVLGWKCKMGIEADVGVRALVVCVEPTKKGWCQKPIKLFLFKFGSMFERHR
jgi:hypothetical protein